MPLVTDVTEAHIIALRTDEARVMLSCGHVATPEFYLVRNWRDYTDTPGMGVTGTPGYGEDPVTGERKCYACITRDEVESLKTATRIVAYVSGDGKQITNWPGGILGTVTGLHVSPSARKTYVSMRDAHGRMWHGVGPAESGTYVSLRPYKTQSASRA